MSSDAGTSQKLVLKSSDGVIFEVEEVVASEMLKHLFEDGCTDGTISLPNVTSKILAKVIEYCKRHIQAAAEGAVVEDDLKAFDCEFVKVDRATLFGLVRASNYLNIKGLLDLTCQAVADSIKGKTPEEIRKFLNIKNEFTSEEEDELRRENQWAFE